MNSPLARPRSTAHRFVRGIVLTVLGTVAVAGGVAGILARGTLDQYIHDQCARTLVLAPYSTRDAARRHIYPRHARTRPHDVQAFAYSTIPKACP